MGKRHKGRRGYKHGKGIQHQLGIKKKRGDMMSFRGIFSLERGEQQAQGGTNNASMARAPWDADDQSWLSINQPDNASAPIISRQFGQQGSGQFNLPRETNMLGMGTVDPRKDPRRASSRNMVRKGSTMMRPQLQNKNR